MLREYLVSVAREHDRITLPVFAKDRDDAIEFVKRTHRARFWSKEYKRVAGAKLKKREVSHAVG